MSVSKFMSDAYLHDVVFYLDDGLLNMNAPKSIWVDQEVMQLIRANKPAIQKQLQDGFDCTRDGLTVAEVKTLTAALTEGLCGKVEA